MICTFAHDILLEAQGGSKECDDASFELDFALSISLAGSRKDMTYLVKGRVALAQTGLGSVDVIVHDMRGSWFGRQHEALRMTGEAHP